MNGYRVLGIALYWSALCVAGQDQDTAEGGTAMETLVHPEGVEEIILPMCRNFLPYNLTKLPNRFNHATQAQVFRAIDRMWPYMDYGCSANFRLFVCSLHLPKYDPSVPTTQQVEPCKETCNKAKKLCKKTMRQTRSSWPRNYKCRNLISRRDEGQCITPNRERRGQLEHTYCTENTIPMCQNLPLNLGSLPNLFLQRNISEITVELGFYQPLIESQCHPQLRFFLCGLYVPFCLRQRQLPFTIPCRELCEEVRDSCSTQYQETYGGLQWPSKLQCHRFSPSDGNRPCAMPGDFN